MLCPAYINIISFFYPIGNTPAVCLTQDLPYGEKANILLLGCGDARNILFTTYCDTKFERGLDITCCDLEPAVIARNILLYTLLLDDAEGLNHAAIWNVYYHLFLDTESLELLHLQSKKLHSFATSVQNWHDSKYGKVLRFCDTGTLSKISDIWASYSTLDLTKAQLTKYDKQFKEHIEKTKTFHNGKFVITGVRSAAPVSLQSLEELPALFQYYWEHGTTDTDPVKVSETTHSNPSFAPLVKDSFTLHYGTEPLLGFPLTTAYVPLSQGSSLCPKPLGEFPLPRAVAAARLQFQAWSESFRKRTRKDLTMRFFAGDALALCNTLEYKLTAREAVSANLYRGPYGLEVLVLDGDDYASRGKAPLLFNVIDSSNLVDDVGAINVLVATSPLLENSVSATLYTESFIKQSKTYKEFIDSLVSGHLPTISILFGLFPMEYWTNATAAATVEEGIFALTSMESKGSSIGQFHNRLVWKKQILGTQRIHFDEVDLSHLLYQMYREMFAGKDLLKLFSKIDIQTILNSSIPRYHRGSFAAMLRLIKDTIAVNWSMVMDCLLDLLFEDTSLPIAGNYLQELLLQLHLFGVYSASSLQQPVDPLEMFFGCKGLRTWKGIPGVLCITLQVPRAKLGSFTERSLTEVGTLPVQCILRTSSGKVQNIFGDLQLSFGKISTSGVRDSASFEVHIVEDKSGWAGDSPLIVSFYVPTWCLLVEGEFGTVVFGIQTTSQSIMKFRETLGIKMDVYKTTIGDRDHVYVTAHSPNQSGYPSIPRQAVRDSAALANSQRTTISAQVDRKTGEVVAFAGRVQLLSEDAKTLLRNKATVDRLQVSPCNVDIIVSSSSRARSTYKLQFPVPVLCTKAKIRIAPQSSYIEVVAPTATFSDGNAFPHFIYPIFLNGPRPVLWNMPNLDLERLPILDITTPKKLKWVSTHMCFQFSSRERAQRMQRSGEGPRDVRVNFKDSLFSIFMRYIGLQSPSSSTVFGINHASDGSIRIIVFISALRLDQANHTVVLDAAVLPLTVEIGQEIRPFLLGLSNVPVYQIKADDDELILWQKVLPAWVERCRQWKHTSSCEYKLKGVIPLTIERGQSPLCSCGNGILPPKFATGVPKWGVVSKHAVRAAISPSFPIPYVEPLLDPVEMKKTWENACQKCGKDKTKEGHALMKCSRCVVAKYCSTECQRGDWQEHKTACRK